MDVAAFVAGIGVLEGYSKAAAFKCNLALGHIAEGGKQAYVLVGALRYGPVHCLYEAGTAVRINGVVSGVVGNEDGVQPVVFCQTGGYGEHNAVAEGNHGAFHIVCVVVLVGDLRASFQNAAVKVFSNEVQGNYEVLYSKDFAVFNRAVCLLLVLTGSVGESYCQGNLFPVFIQKGGAVHPSGIYQYCIHTANLSLFLLFYVILWRIMPVMKSLIVFKGLIFCLLALATCSCAGAAVPVKKYKLEVVAEYPHDPTSYTQGLFFDSEGRLFESTGQKGESKFREVSLETGQPVRNIDFGNKYFMEGSTMMDGKMFLLTWTNRIAFIYDAATLQYQKGILYPREGWGLTNDGKYLIASDGSSQLFFMDTKYSVKRTIVVKRNGKPVKYLNELEYINGKIWANVYTSDYIVIINPSSGEVEGIVDCKGLLPDALRDDTTDVLNGIAYNPVNGKIDLTGKNWKRLYEVKLIEQ